MDGEAARLPTPRFEEDYNEAKLVFDALPLTAAARPVLRARLLSYLLDPLAAVDVAALRRDAGSATVSDDLERINASLRDALELFDGAELWRRDGLARDERARLIRGARLVVDVYGRRGSEPEVLLALSVLETVDVDPTPWSQRIEALLAWVEEGQRLGATSNGLQPPPSARLLLEATADAWPSPAVIKRVTARTAARAEELATRTRRGGGPLARRGLFGEPVADTSESLSGGAVALAALVLRTGQPAQAQQALAALADRPGDDPEVRRLVSATAAPHPAADDYLALARRFLPRVETLGGTSTDRLDATAARAVLRLGIDRYPGHAELLVLAARVCRASGAPLLALRYLEEAQPALARLGGTREEREAQKRDLLDLAFTRLRSRMDPENIAPAVAEADALRTRFAEARRELGPTTPWLDNELIDLELARGYVDAGLVDRAEPIFLRSHRPGALGVEVTLQLANLFVKRGEADRAVRLLREALENHKPEDGSPHETIGFVEAHSKLARALGNALEITGNIEDARRAWGASVHGWERLLVEHLRRKNLSESAEAFVEVGRLYYQLGRRNEGIQKFNEAIEQNESRDQSYIDPLAFLVERGEVDAALDIFRRALARPSRVVSEYVKTYASIWILDLTRRSGRPPEPSADAYLRALAMRKVHLRPPRAAAWYVPLASYVVGRTHYEQMLPLATTQGRRAELYFYEAMRRLGDGDADNAHQLWSKVLQTNMVSFFEYEMASRYLRVGAPSQPPESEPEPGSDKAEKTETI